MLSFCWLERQKPEKHGVSSCCSHSNFWVLGFSWSGFQHHVLSVDDTAVWTKKQPVSQCQCRASDFNVVLLWVHSWRWRMVKVRQLCFLSWVLQVFQLSEYWRLDNPFATQHLLCCSQHAPIHSSLHYVKLRGDTLPTSFLPFLLGSFCSLAVNFCSSLPATGMGRGLQTHFCFRLLLFHQETFDFIEPSRWARMLLSLLSSQQH